MEKQLTIGFGALQPTIAKQLKKQNFKFDTEKVKHYEKLRESVSFCIFNGLITDKSRILADKKLFKLIENHVVSKNKLVRIKK